MPIDDMGQGVGEGTERKIRDFEDYHRFHVQIVRRVIDKPREYRWEPSPIYNYIDLTAGGGEAKGMPGSPVVAIRNLMQSEGEWRAKLCEVNHLATYHLGVTLDAMGEEVRSRFRLFGMDHREAVADIIADIETERKGWLPFGLIYADPNGTLAEAEIDSVRRIVSVYPKIDVLLHLSATTRKRCVTVHGKPSLEEWLGTIGKQTLLIRRPCTAHQWTFCFLTDFSDFPAWERRGFFDSKSPQGAAILQSLTLPEREWKAADERAERQLRLW